MIIFPIYFRQISGFRFNNLDKSKKIQYHLFILLSDYTYQYEQMNINSLFCIVLLHIYYHYKMQLVEVFEKYSPTHIGHQNNLIEFIRIV